MKSIVYIIGLITIILVVGGTIFYYTASNDTKKEFLEKTGLDEKEQIRELVSEIYVECEFISARKNLLGDKWVISGRLYTTDPSLTYMKQTVQFNFSDGSETVTFNYRLNGDQVFARPFVKRFAGHADADFVGMEVIDAE
ncbi:MAG: hypothetical protein P8P74_05330 [Crocinitomicaceae bacterium]|nr:hypothetical protein [Crocinitomicaceae bacterium]